nr:hypothetical protein Iba_chr15cCG7380 [Ipomoea batatas]
MLRPPLPLPTPPPPPSSPDDTSNSTSSPSTRPQNPSDLILVAVVGDYEPKSLLVTEPFHTTLQLLY